MTVDYLSEISSSSPSRVERLAPRSHHSNLGSSTAGSYTRWWNLLIGQGESWLLFGTPFLVSSATHCKSVRLKSGIHPFMTRHFQRNSFSALLHQSMTQLSTKKHLSGVSMTQRPGSNLPVDQAQQRLSNPFVQTQSKSDGSAATPPPCSTR